MNPTDSAPSASPAAPTRTGSPRLLSLDALRGFDMFWIVGAEELVHALHQISRGGWAGWLSGQLTHTDWAGLTFYDLIFPLFVFIVGVASVFSLGRLLEREGRRAAVGRIIRRAVLLYGLGILCYGGFSTPLTEIRLLGVLQRIALCYLFAGLIFCFFRTRGQVIVCAALLVGYWALLTWVPVPGAGAGNFAEGKNLANWVDQQYLPLRKWDGDHDPEGLLSTLPAVATCLLGMFAGRFLKTAQCSDQQKVRALLVAGVAGVALGWLWHLQFPVIKKIWTSSYVLVTAGYSAGLVAVFYWIIEVRHWRRWAQPFVWIGMNSITIYLLHNLVDFPALAQRLVGGDIHRWLGAYGDLAVAGVVIALTFWICRFLYVRQIFLRV